MSDKKDFTEELKTAAPDAVEPTAPDDGQDNGNIEPLVLAEEERVVDSETSKVFNFNGEMFIFDDVDQLNRKMKYDGCYVDFENPVPVKDEGGRVIGSASLSMQGNVLVGEFYIDYSTPERLNIETGTIPLFPHLDSHTEVTASHGGAFTSVYMKVNAVILSMYPPLDLRIPFLK